MTLIDALYSVLFALDVYITGSVSTEALFGFVSRMIASILQLISNSDYFSSNLAKTSRGHEIWEILYKIFTINFFNSSYERNFTIDRRDINLILISDVGTI